MMGLTLGNQSLYSSCLLPPPWSILSYSKPNLHHSFKNIANTIVVGTLYTNYIIGESGDVTVNVSLHNHILIVYTLICD